MTPGELKKKYKPTMTILEGMTREARARYLGALWSTARQCALPLAELETLGELTAMVKEKDLAVH